MQYKLGKYFGISCVENCGFKRGCFMAKYWTIIMTFRLLPLLLVRVGGRILSPRAEYAELQQQLCSSNHCVRRICCRRFVSVQKSLSFSVGATVFHNSASSWPPSFATTLPTFWASHEPATEPLAAASAALLQLCSSDYLLQPYNMCVGYYLTKIIQCVSDIIWPKYTDQYNCSSSLFSLSAAMCRRLSTFGNLSGLHPSPQCC